MFAGLWNQCLAISLPSLSLRSASLWSIDIQINTEEEDKQTISPSEWLIARHLITIVADRRQAQQQLRSDLGWNKGGVQRPIFSSTRTNTRGFPRTIL